MSETIYATDIVSDGLGMPYERRWACEPPCEGAKFRVMVDRWDFDSEPMVRTILEWVE